MTAWRSAVSETKAPRWFWLLAAATFVAIFALARHTSLIFPYPWNDEARFYLPSWAFSRTSSLKPEILHAPDGIFWTPHAFYVALGLILRLWGRSIEVARTANQLLVAGAACLLVAAHRWIAGTAAFAALSALVLVSPPVILAANEVRMESLIVLLYAVSVWLVCTRQPLAAGAVLLLSLLVHPALACALGLFCAAFGAQRLLFSSTLPNHKPSRMLSYGNALLLFAVLALVLMEAAFVARHWGLFRAHMAYQSQRKLHHTFLSLLAKPQGAVLLAESGVSAWLLRQGRTRRIPQQTFWLLLQLAAIPLGLQVYAVLGAEFQYDVYSLAFAPATFFCIACRLAKPTFDSEKAQTQHRSSYTELAVATCVPDG